MNFQSMIEKLMTVPIPVSGLALGIASLGWCWENILRVNGVIQSISAIIAGVILLIVTPKLFSNFQLLKKNLADPIVGSVIPTYAMTAMIISNTVGQVSPWLGNSLWLFSISLHLIFLSYFLFERIKSFNLEDMVPSWFIPPVGIIVADVSFIANPTLQPVADFALNLGLIAYAVMLPCMIYRLIFSPIIPDNTKPTIAIMAAPASLSLAGYLSITAQPSPIIIALLFGIAILMTAVIYLALFKLIQLPFTPGFSAFTFPMVIGATALFKLAEWMRTAGLPEELIYKIHWFGIGELLVASGLVAYVLMRYIQSLHNALINTKANGAIN